MPNLRGWEWLGLLGAVVLFVGIGVAMVRASRRGGQDMVRPSLGVGPAQAVAWGAIFTVGGLVALLVLPAGLRLFAVLAVVVGLVVLAIGGVGLARRSDSRAPVSAAVPPPPPPDAKPAGWYPAPNGIGQRYWDGEAWTEHTAP